MQGEDWRVIKALCYQESLFKHRAVSFAGAEGLCQIMPNTFKFVINRTGMKGVDVFNPKDNIFASVAYLAYLKGQWNPSNRTNWQIWELSFASYNSGLGNVLKAQKTCGNESLWLKIKQCMNNVTGKRNSQETINYVSKIERWYQELKKCEPDDIQGGGLYSISQLIDKLYSGYTRLEVWLKQSVSKSMHNHERKQQRIVRWSRLRTESMYSNAWKGIELNGTSRRKILFKVTDSPTKTITNRRVYI